MKLQRAPAVEFSLTQQGVLLVPFHAYTAKGQPDGSTATVPLGKYAQVPGIPTHQHAAKEHSEWVEREGFGEEFCVLSYR